MRTPPQLPKAGSHEKLVINLWKNSDGVIFTRSVEILDEVTRVRFSFGSDLPVGSIFTQQAVCALTDVLDDASSQLGMLSMPDLKIQLEGILLSGCRVMVTATEVGVEHIMIRFVKYYGRVTSLFREDFSHRDSLSEDAVDHAVYALERVYLPLRNFSYYLNDFLERFPGALERQHIEALENIRGEINTLGYFTDLINHYVSSREILSNERGGEQPPLQGGHIEQLIADANAVVERKRIMEEVQQANQ
ncbi:MAG: hypothetical protein AAGG72_06085 [Pseudomonadota bacterium]